MARNKGERNGVKPTWKCLTILVVVLLVQIAFIVAVIVIVVGKTSDNDVLRVAVDCRQRSSNLKAVYTKSGNLFRDLTPDEIRRVQDYVLSDSASLNLVSHDRATLNSDYVYLIEFQNPDKDEALRYLDEDGPKPARTANVVLFRGSRSPPHVEEVLVTLSSPMRHEPNHRLTNRTIAFNARPDDVKEYDVVDEIVMNFTAKVYKVLVESYDGYSYHNCTDRCLDYSNTAPVSIHKSGERHSWIYFMRSVPGLYLHPIGLQLLLKREKRDTSEWTIEMVYYSNTTFDSVDEFLEAYENGGVKKIFLPAPTKNELLLFSSLRRRATNPQPSEPLRHPRQYEPDGRRFTVNDNHIEYMGWSFDFRVRTTSGPQLFDVRFNGERIVYELSLQEMTSCYGAYSPMQSYTDYVDSAWAAGATFELVKGVDCPHNAVYFDVTHLVDSDSAKTMRDAVCVFEQNTGTPIRRHYDNDYEGGYNFYGGTPGTALTMRLIATAYNYDYIYDFVFYPDGVIQPRVSTTGYIQATLWSADEHDYGTEVHRHVAGTVHDHLFHYKVDLDVGGRRNSYEMIQAKVENISSRWFPRQRHIQKRVVRTQMTTEKEAAYRFDFKQPSYLNFYNPARTNSDGHHRGYRIQLGSILNQLYPEGWPYTNSLAWSFYQMAVTKYKWSEERSSSIYNQNDMYAPVVNFHDFIADNEDIVDTDLVSWVSLGIMHIPHTEDMPITPTSANQASFYLRPFNYFDENPVSSSRDGVYITPASDGTSTVDTDKGLEVSTCVPKPDEIEFNGRYS